jgi:hypothetical protein
MYMHSDFKMCSTLINEERISLVVKMHLHALKIATAK